MAAPTLLKASSFLLLLAFAADAAQADWKTDWERTLAAAKKEGRLILYIARYGQPEILDQFQKEFPWLKIVTVNGPSERMGTRILAEQRAGKVFADLFSGAANTNYNVLYAGKALAPLKPLLVLPEVVDESKWYDGRHTYMDREREHIFIYIANPGTGTFSYNTKLANRDEFRSYWDLVNPKWKGKITSQPPTGPGLGGMLKLMYYHPDLGPEYIRRLYGTMDVTFGDRRAITDWLGLGKFALCIACRDVERAKEQGLPVASLDLANWKEAGNITIGSGSISFIKGAPHPNAAKVFLNWFLSRRGQLLLQSSDDLLGGTPPNSRRIDIPKDMLAQENRLIKGRKYFDLSEHESSDIAPIYAFVRELLGPRAR